MLSTLSRWQKIVGLVALWKLLLILVVLVASTYLQYRPDFAYTHITENEQRQLLGGQAHWMNAWANFDGVHYLRIARRGYVDEARFFPLYPFLIAITSPSYSWGLIAGQSVSLLALAGAVMLLHHLVGFDADQNSDPNHLSSLEYKSIFALLAFPTAFFLGSVYSESLFLLLVIASFLAARKGKWILAGVGAWLVLSTRLVGIAIIPALLVEWWWQRRSNSSRTQIWQLVPVLASIISLGLYAWYNVSHWDRWLYFVTAHTELANSRSSGLVNPLRLVWRYLRLLGTVSPKLYEWWIALLELFSLVWVGIIGWNGWRQLRPSYVVFVGFGIALPLLSGTLTGFPRYVLVLWPLHIWIAQHLHGWRWRGYLFTSILIQIALVIAFSHGYFVA